MEQYISLSALMSSTEQQEQSVTIDSFLASVEKQAFVIAMAACHDQDAALDIVQDAMFSMVRNYVAKPTEQWPPLFFKVLNNRISDHHRKRGFSRLTQWFGRKGEDTDSVEDAVDQLDSETFEPDVMLDSLDLNGAMQEGLEKLSFKQQQALVLRLWQGLSVKETAEAMGVSEGSVKTHLSRAVREMREQLKEFEL